MGLKIGDVYYKSDVLTFSADSLRLVSESKIRKILKDKFRRIMMNVERSLILEKWYYDGYNS